MRFSIGVFFATALLLGTFTGPTTGELTKLATRRVVAIEHGDSPWRAGCRLVSHGGALASGHRIVVPC